MALDKMRSVDLRIDKANDYLVTKLLSKQGDYNGRELIVQITNGGVVENQITTQMNLGWRHLKYGNSGLDPFKLIDADKGLFGISYSEEMLRTGDVLCTVQIIQGGKLTETRNFNLEVEESPINKKLMVTQDSFKALEKALTQVNEWDGKFESKYAGLEEEYALELTTLKQETTAQFQQTEMQIAKNRSSEIEVIAHRGFSQIAPENTLASFTEAVKAGFDSLETDVQITSDGHAVCIHDKELTRTTNGTGEVKNMTLSALQSLDASKTNPYYSPSIIPTFQDYLDICKGNSKFIYPEIKGYRTNADIKIMTDLIATNGWDDKCVIQAFNYSDLEIARKFNEKITLGFLVGTVPNFNTALDLAKKDGNAILLVMSTIISSDTSLLSKAKQQGIDVGIWTVDSSIDFEYFKKIGVKRIMTNTNNRGL